MAFILISGMTCSGKTTLEGELVKNGFQKLITSTTRDLRPNEENGVHYHFLNSDQFERELASNNIIEHNTYNGHKYGISRKELFKHVQSETDTVIVLDPSGVKKMQSYMSANKIPHISVFISADIGVVVSRLTDRLESNSLSKSEFISRVTNISLNEVNWYKDAMKSHTYDLIMESVDQDSVSFLLSHIKRTKFI
ncbi:hypothetical protein [Acinetobacter brisouii]|uniref:hypothetical protein n=1 Tax=Acinetobacter brisouii TaxID=396323 RepID=UPI00124CE00A|nr:hypothetical protein [Acinetobacter brisouii]